MADWICIKFDDNEEVWVRKASVQVVHCRGLCAELTVGPRKESIEFEDAEDLTEFLESLGID